MRTKIFWIGIQLVFITSLATLSFAEIKTQEIEYHSGNTTLKGYLAYDDAIEGKRPGVLVVHEWWGHNAHARNRARMIAELGYTALAIDMYGDGKTADHPKQAGELMTAAMSDWEAAKGRFHAAKKILQEHATVDPSRIASIGFCFGGTVSMRMARGGEDLRAVVAFHSGLPVDSPVVNGKVTASILVINGADDGWVPPDVVAKFKQQMAEAKADLTYISLPGVKHGYTNPQADEFREKFKISNLEYNAAADKSSWDSLRTFFERVLK